MHLGRRTRGDGARSGVARPVFRGIRVPARAMLNRFVTEMADAKALELPLQASLAGPL